MKKLTVILGILLTVGGASESAFAESKRSDRHVGMTLGFNSQPTPSMASANLNLQMFGLLRISGGGGFTALPDRAKLTSIVYNVTLGWILDIMIGEAVRQAGARDFSFYIKGGRIQRSFTYGGGAKLMVPGWTLSPTIGGHWARIVGVRSNPYGLDDSARKHYYYSAGFDLLTDGGFNFGVDLNYAPALPGINYFPGLYLGFMI